MIVSSIIVGRHPRKHGEAKRAWAENEPCRKGCGRRPNGRTFNGWKVHEATCIGKPPNEPLKS